MVRSLGSGFIINQSGFVLTNNHVIDKASEIHVRLADGRDLPGKVVGRDPKTDLALVKIEATGLTVVPVGDSSKLEVGAPVMAIGNPFGLEQTVTTGIVSATGRVIGEGPYDDFIQTDASINPGNSGGPLINAQGQAVGINTAIFSRTGGSVGIGFAIPVNLAKPVVTQLAQSGHVQRGWLGVSIQSLTPDLAKTFGLQNTHGALVASVSDGSPAAKAGLKAGDVISEYNGREVGRTEELPRAVAETPVGREVPITVIREGKPVKLTAKIAQLEDNGQELAAAEAPGDKPALGVDVESLTPALAHQLGISESRGVIVKAVRDGGPAANAGIQAGDVIVEVDRHPVATVAEMKSALDKRAKGSPVLLLVHRDGSSLYAAVQM
jgi:serine protease Do